MESIENPRELQFAHLAESVWKKLGEIPRTGWVDRKVKNPETVQEHTISLRNLAVEIFPNLREFTDEEKSDLLDMLEVHDWPESEIGDLVILEQDTEKKRLLKEEKFKKEEKAIRKICAGLGPEEEKIVDLWLRFESSDDKVAKFARELDKYQAVEKAYEHEKAQSIPLFAEFRDYSAQDIAHKVLIERMQKLI